MSVGLPSASRSVAQEFLAIFCRAGSAHPAEHPCKVLLRFEAASPHIDVLETAGDQGGQTSEIEGTVQLGGPVEFLTQRVLPSLAPLVRLGLYLRVTLGNTEQLLEALSENDLDLAIVGQHKKVRNIDSEPIYQEGLVLVATPSWMNHIPRKGELNVRHLDGIPLLAYSEEMPQIQEFWESAFDVPTRMSGRGNTRALPQVNSATTAIQFLSH